MKKEAPLIITFVTGMIMIMQYFIPHWPFSNLQQMLDTDDAETIFLANSVDADIVEYGEDIINEEELRNRFEGYILKFDTISTKYSEAQDIVEYTSTTATETIRSSITPQEVVEDYRLGKVFA